MSEPIALDKLLADVTEEVYGYLRDSLQAIVTVAQKAQRTIDAGQIPLAEASRLLSDAQAVVRRVDYLMTYQEIAEAMEATD